MNVLFEEEPSEESLQMLHCLKNAVTKALERKRRLGEYAVVWENGHAVFLGEHTPSNHDQTGDVASD
jgi:hypothetical protein